MTGSVALNAKRTLKHKNNQNNMADLDSSLNSQWAGYNKISMVRNMYFLWFHETAMKIIFEHPISPSIYRSGVTVSLGFIIRSSPFRSNFYRSGAWSQTGQMIDPSAKRPDVYCTDFSNKHGF